MIILADSVLAIVAIAAAVLFSQCITHPATFKYFLIFIFLIFLFGIIFHSPHRSQQLGLLLLTLNPALRSLHMQIGAVRK